MLTVFCFGIASTLLVNSSVAADTGSILFQPVRPAGDTIIIPYRANLTDPAGRAAPDGAYDLRFALYDDSTAGALLWGEQHDDVVCVDGAVSVEIGAIQPLPAALVSAATRWLAISVRGPTEANFTLLEPRQVLAPAAEAINQANTATCVHDHSGETWTLTAGTGLRVDNTSGVGLYGKSTDYIGVFGSSTNHWSGWFDNGIRITDSPWHGIEINASNWAGVWVENAGFAGVEANGAKGDGVFGVSKDVDSVGKAGAHGYATGGFFYGVLGQDGSGTDAGYALRTRGFPDFSLSNGDARVNDDLYVDGNCSGCATTFIARNDGAYALAPGDIVTIGGAGKSNPAHTGRWPLLLARRLTTAVGDTALLGVVVEGAPPKADMGVAGNGTREDYIPSGGYMFVAAPGQLVQMNVVAMAGAVQVGDPLAAGPAGVVKATSAAAEKVNSAKTVVIGRALESLAEGQARIWVMLTFR